MPAAAQRNLNVAKVDEALKQRLSRLMFEGPENELVLTENAQPALMAVSLAVVARDNPSFAAISEGWSDLCRVSNKRRISNPRRKESTSVDADHTPGNRGTLTACAEGQSPSFPYVEGLCSV